MISDLGVLCASNPKVLEELQATLAKMQEVETAIEEAVDECQGDGIDSEVEAKMNQVLLHSTDIKRRIATEIRFSNMRAKK